MKIVSLKILKELVNPKMAVYNGIEMMRIIRRHVQQITPGEKPISIKHRQSINHMSKQSTRRLHISSPAFPPDGEIPTIYTCEGANFNPSLLVGAVPDEAKSLAIIMEDPDELNGGFDHWIVWNIPVGPIQVDSQSGVCGLNGKGTIGYYGPCPVNGTHRYFFNIYALDTLLSLQQGATKNELVNAMDPHILSSGTLMGKYQKKVNVKKASYQHSQYR